MINPHIFNCSFHIYREIPGRRSFSLICAVIDLKPAQDEVIGGTSEAKTDFDDVIDEIITNKSTDALNITLTWDVVLMNSLFEKLVFATRA